MPPHEGYIATAKVYQATLGLAPWEIMRVTLLLQRFPMRVTLLLQRFLAKHYFFIITLY